MADNQNLRVAQRFGNGELCIAAVQICWVAVKTCGIKPHWTGTFSLKIRRGSMNLRVR